MGLDWASIASGYSIINYNGEAVYIEGLKKIVSIDTAEIVVDTKNARVAVTGTHLEIISLEENTIIVRGKITAANIV